MGIFSSIKEKIQDYVEVQVKLAKLNLISHTASVVSFFMFALLCLFIVFAIVLFIGFGLVEGLVSFGLTRVAAYFITVGAYIVLLLGVMALRKSITRGFAGNVISMMTAKEQDDDEDE